jgi:hypothetical protein
MAGKKFGESKGWTWTIFVLLSFNLSFFVISGIIDLNGTANWTPIIIGVLVVALFLVGFFLFTVKSISDASKTNGGN